MELPISAFKDTVAAMNYNFKKSQSELSVAL